MKAQSLPPKIRGFFKIFDSICFRHNYSQVFDDFLTIVMCCYSWGQQEPLYHQTIKRYNKGELNQFANLLGEMIMVHEKQTAGGGWFDLLGMVYEEITSRYKASAMGQFFTPPGICELIAKMQMVEISEKPLKINDPCSGSGRMLLACNDLYKGHYYVAQDKDRMCVKMTCINMMMHGLIGEVHEMNTLTMEHYQGYKINHTSFRSIQWIEKRAEVEEAKVIEEVKQPDDELKLNLLF